MLLVCRFFLLFLEEQPWSCGFNLCIEQGFLGPKKFPLSVTQQQQDLFTRICYLHTLVQTDLESQTKMDKSSMNPVV